MSWHHLWFLAYVLVLTFVLLPYFLWARSERGQAALEQAGHLTARLGLQWLMVLPLAASILWLAPISYNTNGLIGDWHGLVYYGALLLYGAFLFGSPAVAGGAEPAALAVVRRSASRPTPRSTSCSSTAPCGRRSPTPIVRPMRWCRR